jgi:flagellar basal-body rod protein FlgG
LEAVQGNLFRETGAANGVEIGNPGERGFGTLAQGYLESSNVNIDEEMFELNRVRNACKALTKVASARQK